jgi:exonuclease VII small subunit
MNLHEEIQRQKKLMGVNERYDDLLNQSAEQLITNVFTNWSGFNSKENAEKCIEVLDKRSDMIMNMAKERVEKLREFVAGKTERTNMLNQLREHKELKKFGNDARARVIAIEKIENAENRFEEAKNRYNQAREAYKENKNSFKNAASKLNFKSKCVRWTKFLQCK